MVLYNVIWMSSVLVAVAVAYTDTSDRKASMQYVVHDVPTVDDPFDTDAGVVKREDKITKDEWPLRDPDRPLQRAKRLDLNDQISILKRKKRGAATALKQLQRVKRVKRAMDLADKPLKRVTRDEQVPLKKREKMNIRRPLNVRMMDLEGGLPNSKREKRSGRKASMKKSERSKQERE